MNSTTLDRNYVDPLETTVSSDGDWLREAQRQLLAIENLKPGWDSHGADAPNPQTVRAAKDLLTIISRSISVPKPHINPTPNGGVQFEWDKDLCYLEIELIDSATAIYYFENRESRDEIEGTLYYGRPLGPVLEYLERF